MIILNLGLFDLENLRQISCNETWPPQSSQHCVPLHSECLVTSISGNNLQLRDTETQTEINDFESKTRIFWMLLYAGADAGVTSDKTDTLTSQKQIIEDKIL